MENEKGDVRKKEILLSIIVPVYNESKRIHNLKTIVEYCKNKSEVYEIIVVDDGSKDKTASKSAEILKEYKNSRILASDKNYGKGHAVAMGMKEANGNYHLFMDVDLSTPLAHIQQALDAAQNFSVVTGTRKNDKAKIIKRQSWIRESMGKGFTLLSQIILNTWISDFTCGFKLFSREASAKIFNASRIHRWAFDSEILYLANKFGYKIHEIPVEWKNDDDTRVNIRKVIMPTLFDLVKIKFGKYQTVDINPKVEQLTKETLLAKRVNNNLTFIIFAVFLLTLRILIFLITQDVGMEHDSAWYLGVAKNLAQNGKYASFTNTSTDTKTISPSIHNRITVQDKQGNAYFPAGVTAGPGYVIPQAIFMKLFGFGFWQYRVWPILGYIGLVSILLFLSYRYGGSLSLGVLALIFWARPDMMINYAFEAFSEHIALLFALLSLILANIAIKKNDTRNILVFSGFVFGLAIMTKNLSFLLMPGVIFILFPDKIFNISLWKSFFRKSLSFLLGVSTPILAFIMYEYIYLTMNFGKGAYAGVITDFLLHWKTGGGGINVFDPKFIGLKVMSLNHVGNANIIFFLIFIFLFPFYLLKKLDNNGDKKFLASLFVMFLGNYFWFVYVAASGWTRHVWMGLLILILLITIIFSKLIKGLLDGSIWNIYFVAIGIILFSIVIHEHANYSFLLSKEKFTNMWAKSFVGATPNKLQGFVFSPLFSWSDLQGVSSFLKKKENSNKSLYFSHTFLVTEVAMEIMRPIYPVMRILKDKNEGLLIIGPYQKGEYSLVGNFYDDTLIKKYCKKTVYINNSYTICNLNKSKLRSEINSK